MQQQGMMQHVPPQVVPQFQAVGGQADVLTRLEVVNVPQYLQPEEFRQQFMVVKGCMNAHVFKQANGYTSYCIDFDSEENAMNCARNYNSWKGWGPKGLAFNRVGHVATEKRSLSDGAQLNVAKMPRLAVADQGTAQLISSDGLSNILRVANNVTVADAGSSLPHPGAAAGGMSLGQVPHQPTLGMYQVAEGSSYNGSEAGAGLYSMGMSMPLSMQQMLGQGGNQSVTPGMSQQSHRPGVPMQGSSLMGATEQQQLSVNQRPVQQLQYNGAQNSQPFEVSQASASMTGPVSIIDSAHMGQMLQQSMQSNANTDQRGAAHISVPAGMTLVKQMDGTFRLIPQAQFSSNSTQVTSQALPQASMPAVVAVQRGGPSQLQAQQPQLILQPQANVQTPHSVAALQAHQGVLRAPEPSGVGATPAAAEQVQPATLPANAVETLYVDDVPKDMSRRELSHIFRPFGGFKEVRIVNKPGKEGREGRTFAFAEFENAECADAALKCLNGYTYERENPQLGAMQLRFARPFDSHGFRDRERDRDRDGPHRHGSGAGYTSRNGVRGAPVHGQSRGNHPRDDLRHDRSEHRPFKRW